MRAAIWIALLVAAFVLAWQLEDRWSDAHRAERDAAYSRITADESALPEGFGRVVVGAPSGADPILGQQPPDVGSGTRTGMDATSTNVGAEPARSASPPSNPAGLRRHVVRKGESLSKICAAFYGTARKDVVDAVARANGLTNSGAIREGQALVLPTLEELRAAPR